MIYELGAMNLDVGSGFFEQKNAKDTKGGDSEFRFMSYDLGIGYGSRSWN